MPYQIPDTNPQYTFPTGPYAGTKITPWVFWHPLLGENIFVLCWWDNTPTINGWNNLVNFADQVLDADLAQGKIAFYASKAPEINAVVEHYYPQGPQPPSDWMAHEFVPPAPYDAALAFDDLATVFFAIWPCVKTTYDTFVIARDRLLKSADTVALYKITSKYYPVMVNQSVEALLAYLHKQDHKIFQ